ETTAMLRPWLTVVSAARDWWLHAGRASSAMRERMRRRMRGAILTQASHAVQDWGSALSIVRGSRSDDLGGGRSESIAALLHQLQDGREPDEVREHRRADRDRAERPDRDDAEVVAE